MFYVFKQFLNIQIGTPQNKTVQEKRCPLFFKRDVLNK